MYGTIHKDSGMPAEAWWRALRDGVCVLQFDDDARIAESVTTFTGVEHTADGDALCFDFAPPAPRREAAPPETVRLIVLSGDSSTTYHLRVTRYSDTRLAVRAAPLSVDRRWLRRAPRTQFDIGPCPAVIYAADGQWRGILDLWLRDVSEFGVGFRVELRRAFVLGIGDSVRAPVTLPDGRRTWIEGKVTWLTPDGCGGIATREPPLWSPAPPQFADGA